MAGIIIEDEAFCKQVEQLGGAEVIDLALETIMDGLCHNPRGFHYHEAGNFSFRYAKTHPIGDDIPGFTVIFILDKDDNVHLKQIEQDVSF